MLPAKLIQYPRAAHSRAIAASPLKQWITTRSAEPSSSTRRTSGHASRTWTTIGLPVSFDSAMCVRSARIWSSIGECMRK